MKGTHCYPLLGNMHGVVQYPTREQEETNRKIKYGAFFGQLALSKRDPTNTQANPPPTHGSVRSVTALPNHSYLLRPQGALEVTKGRGPCYGYSEESGRFRALHETKLTSVLRLERLSCDEMMGFGGPDSLNALVELHSKALACSRGLAYKGQGDAEHSFFFENKLVSQDDYDKGWEHINKRQNLLLSHTANAHLILFQSFYRGQSLCSLDRMKPSYMAQCGLTPEKLLIFRAIERSSQFASPLERYNKYLEAVQGVNQVLLYKKASKTLGANDVRKELYRATRIVRIAFQNLAIRSSQVLVAGVHPWPSRQEQGFGVLNREKLHRFVRSLNPYMIPLQSSCDLLRALLAGKDIPRFMKSEKGKPMSWSNLTTFIDNHVLIVTNNLESPFFVAVANGVCSLKIPRIAIQVNTETPCTWQAPGYDPVCFEPPKNLFLRNEEAYFGAKARTMESCLPLNISGVTKRDGCASFRTKKRSQGYESDNVSDEAAVRCADFGLKHDCLWPFLPACTNENYGNLLHSNIPKGVASTLDRQEITTTMHKGKLKASIVFKET